MTEGTPGSIRVRILIVVILAAPLGSLRSEGQNVVLRDDFDTGIEGWIYVDEPEAVLSWDPAEGSPDAGSLVLSTTEPPTRFDGFRALGPCMNSVPGEVWMMQSEVRKTGSVLGNCVPFVSVYDRPNCTGEGTSTGGGGLAQPITPEVWHSIDATMPSLSFSESARPVLLMSVPSGVTISCHLDSIVVSNNRLIATEEIPAFSTLGLLVMAILLAASAVALLVRNQLNRKSPGTAGV